MLDKILQDTNMQKAVRSMNPVLKVRGFKMEGKQRQFMNHGTMAQADIAEKI